MSQQIINLVEKSSLRGEVPQFAVGDEVDVHTRILEGEKERIQIFNGTVIARSGSGTREMFTVRRIVQGEGVERKFPLHSPKIANIVVKRSSVVRRAKLYFLRERVGKAVRLRERREETEAPAKGKGTSRASAKKKPKAEPAGV
jgi:large subunit ribosomal protein L19